MKDNEALLSLKNVYRLLTRDDYPLHSRAVLGKAERKGLTLTGFWKDILSGDLAITPEGERLWDTEARRARYQSDLFNRSRPHTFYAEYFQAVSECLSPETLLNVIQRLSEDSTARL